MRLKIETSKYRKIVCLSNDKLGDKVGPSRPAVKKQLGAQNS